MTRARAKWQAVGVLVFTLASGCGPAPVDIVEVEQFYKKVDLARGCSAGDTCVLVSPGPCTCAVPVNAQRQREIEEARDDLSCGKTNISCPRQENLRCEAGVCVTDMS